MNEDRLSIVNTLLAMIGIAASAYVAYDVFYKQQELKPRFAVREISRWLMTTDDISVTGKSIKYSVDNILYDKLFFSSLIITNKGHGSIASQDFFKELTITPKDKLEIVSLNVTHVFPENLDIQWKKKGNTSYSLKPTLLNAGDSFAITLLLNPDKSIKYSDFKNKSLAYWTARIKNISAIEVSNIFEEVPLKNVTIRTSYSYKDMLSGDASFIIELAFKSIPLFILLVISISYIGIWIIKNDTNKKEKIFIIINVLLSVSTSEIVIYYIFGNSLGSSSDKQIHIPLIALHLLFLVYLFFLRRAFSPQPNEGRN